MFRRQQTQQTKPNTGIKSFSSRVERRRKAMVEEKKEEPVKQVKAIPKRTAKAEDLPVLGDPTNLDASYVEKSEVDSDSNFVITLKPLVGDYQFNVLGTDDEATIQFRDFTLPSTVTSNNPIKFIVPSYQPTSTNAKLYGDNAPKKIIFGNSDTHNLPADWIGITDLYLVNPDDSKTASDVFTVTENKFSKISGYAATTYTSNDENHSDVKNLHSTNYIIKKTGETGEVENNLLVTGDIPPEVYDSLKLPFKLDTSLNVLASDAADNDVIYQINSVNAIPLPEGTSTVDDSSIDLSTLTLGTTDITSKFDNFYVNNVTIKPDSANNLVTRFTQTSGTKYLGSNVTILAAPAGTGEGGVTAPVNDPLVPLIESITYDNNTITFNIKPNEKSGLLVKNRESTNVTNHIIINLSSSTFSTQLAQWTPSTETATNIAFVQEAVILNGEWTNTSGPVVGLNGYLGNQPETINTITIKYFKKGVSGANDSIETVNLVPGTPSATPGDKQFKLGTVSNTINMLYLVNGKVDSESRLLTPLSDAFSSTTSDTTTYSISEVPELVKVDNNTTLSEGQIGLYDKTKVGDNSKNATIGDFYVTNLMPQFNPDTVEEITQERIVNLAVNGTLPDWTIGSTLWKDEVKSEGKYGYKVTQDTTDKSKWTIGTGSKYINKVNWLPVDGYGELDIGVDFTTTPATLGTTTPIVLPESSDGTKNELKLMNFNMNEIYVKQTKSTADLDLTATVNHNYEGATVYNAVEMGGVSGTASTITDLISGFELNETGKVLTIKIKPSDKKNILKDYRKGDSEEADTKAIILDITGNLNLCKSLVDALTDDATQEVIEPNGFVIEQEALILDDTDIPTGSKSLDVTMNESVAINSLTLKYLKLNGNKYEEVTIPTVTNPPSPVIVPGHVIDKLYFTHGTIVTQSDTNLKLLTPLVATTVFTSTTTGTGESATTTYSVNIEDELIPSGTPSAKQIVLVQEVDAVDELICTNIKNMVNASGKTNIVVGGDKDTGIIPTWVFEQFKTSNKIGVSTSGVITGESPSWTVTSINDFPCKGYGELDVGINTTGKDDYRSILSFITSTKEGEYEDEEDEGELEATTTTYQGVEGFYVNEVYVPRGGEEEQINAQFTSHIGLNTVGALVMTPDASGTIQPTDDAKGDFIKISTLDQLYNLMMEPRTYVGKSSDNSSEVPVGILFATDKTASLNSVLLEEGYHLIYYPALGNNIDERLKLVTQEGDNEFTVPEGAVEVNIKGEILDKNEDLDDDANNGKRSVKVRIYLEYVDKASNAHRIPYGVVGNGPFQGSELDTKYEVDGNKWNLKIEDIMKSINERQVNVDSSTDKLELSVESLTDDENKIKKSEMYEYICEIKRTLNAMPFNSRYLNEILGYLSKCLAFEQVRLPSIREADNQGLESVNEEYDAESNPDGWIEKYTEEFEKNGIIYKVVSDYDNYKFRDGGKHDELINDMRSKLAQIYMFNELGETLKLDQIMNKLLNEYTDIWMKYYKGLVVPNDQIMSDFSDIEIYEDENIYKVFEGNSEEGTYVISQLTDGSADDEDGTELKAFIEEIMKYFKDEINEVTGTKKDIKGITIEDMVAYEDPLKETTSSNATGEEIDDALTNNENNLIEYSQMLSTIQGERNKLQRQGNKNKIILKFTQTVKGTFFEILGKEKMNSEQKSQIFGFFLSELKEYVSHAKKTVNLMDRKSRRGVKTIQAIPEEVEGKRYLRITKVPEFYVGDPLDWINDNYYSNKIFLQNCDNLYVGIDPELDQRIAPIGTPVSAGSSELKEQEMIGYYILKIQY